MKIWEQKFVVPSPIITRNYLREVQYSILGLYSGSELSKKSKYMTHYYIYSMVQSKIGDSLRSHRLSDWNGVNIGHSKSRW